MFLAQAMREHLREAFAKIQEREEAARKASVLLLETAIKLEEAGRIAEVQVCMSALFFRRSYLIIFY